MQHHESDREMQKQQIHVGYTEQNLGQILFYMSHNTKWQMDLYQNIRVCLDTWPLMSRYDLDKGFIYIYKI